MRRRLPVSAGPSVPGVARVTGAPQAPAAAT